MIPDWPTLAHVEKEEVVLPYYTRDLEDKQLREEDGQCMFDCEFSIPNPKNVRWFKNKVEIFHGNNLHIEHHDCLHQLTIKKLSVKDAGKYTITCDDIKSSAWLHVQG